MKKTQYEIEQLKAKYPNVPEHALPIARKKRTAANELTYQIIKYVQSLGFQAYRINSGGTYDPRLKKFRYSNMKKGLADIQAIIKGRFVAIEVKVNKDRQSKDQKARESEIKQAGGFYLIARTYEQFQNELQLIIDSIQ